MKQSENEERVSDQQEMAVIVDELFRGGSFRKERFLLESIAAPVTGEWRTTVRIPHLFETVKRPVTRGHDHEHHIRSDPSIPLPKYSYTVMSLRPTLSLRSVQLEISSTAN